MPNRAEIRFRAKPIVTSLPGDIYSDRPKKLCHNRAFSHDATAAILVFQNNETAAMLVYQQNPLGVERFSHVNCFFCSNKLA